MQLEGSDGHTSATVTTDVQLSGKVATMGQGVLQDVSGRLVETFAKNLATMLEGGGPPASEAPAEPAREAPPEATQAPPAPKPAPQAAEALDLGSLGGAVVAERLKNPKTLAALALGALLVALLLGRRRR
jgi:uncharacterized protein